MKSLRMVVEKWLAPTPSASVRVARFAGGARGRRCVRVEVHGSQGTIALHFFRHVDGAWQVFPPENMRLTMRPYAA